MEKTFWKKTQNKGETNLKFPKCEECLKHKFLFPEKVKFKIVFKGHESFLCRTHGGILIAKLKFLTIPYELFWIIPVDLKVKVPLY
jgi:hypothetical protein